MKVATNYIIFFNVNTLIIKNVRKANIKQRANILKYEMMIKSADKTGQ